MRHPTRKPELVPNIPWLAVDSKDRSSTLRLVTPSEEIDCGRNFEEQKNAYWTSENQNTVKALNSGDLWVLKNSPVIKRCRPSGPSLTKIVTFGTKHFAGYSRHAAYLGYPLPEGFTVYGIEECEYAVYYWNCGTK